MENIRVNSCENLDKRGNLQGQIKDNYETYDDFKSGLCESDKKYFAELLRQKDEVIDGLYKEIDRLTVENNRLIVLHNINELNSSKEINSEDNPFLANQVEGYDIDEYAKAFEEENKVIM